MARAKALKQIVDSPESVPDKLYFKIGEVSRLVGVEPYVLRYWETEFSDVAPVKSRTNQRLYRRKDVQTLLTIRNLLHRERFTIEGARKRLKGEGRGSVPGSASGSQLGLGLGTFEAAKDLRSRLESLARQMRQALKD